MKLITFCIPSYNSEGYLSKCVDSILTAKKDIEIIIVNDGSTDHTLQIAEEYQRKFPSIVKVVNKENGGHGSGVNAGIKNATGLYYKVVDSDDWVDTIALNKLLDTITENLNKNLNIDLYITNFVYDKFYENQTHTMSFQKNMPTNKVITWKEVKKFHAAKMLLMHSLLYKTQVVRDSNLILPEHTFYVDNIYAYTPLPYVKNMFYLDVDLYHYFIGRSDQSVNYSNFTKRYKQQIRVYKEMVNAYEWKTIKTMNKGLKNYLWHCLNITFLTTNFFTGAIDTKERRQAYKDLRIFLKEKDPKLFHKLLFSSYSTLLLFFNWRLRGWIMRKGYSITCKKIMLG